MSHTNCYTPFIENIMGASYNYFLFGIFAVQTTTYTWKLQDILPLCL